MFNLEDYEDVNSRIKRFRAEYISGRIETHIMDVNLVEGYILVEARVYREHEDSVPAAIDYAYGHVKFYRENMKRWFIEDTTTSAVGRAIGLLMPGEHRPTKQNMAQVQQAAAPTLESDPWSNVPFNDQSTQPAATGMALIAQELGGQITDSEPHCVHGLMIFKKGISKTTGNAYQGYTCSSKIKPQCPARWEKN